MHRKSLLWHIFLPFLAVIVLSLVLITGYTSRSLRDFFYQQSSSDLTTRAHLMTDEMVPLLLRDDEAAIQRTCEVRGKASDTRVTVVAPDGRVIGDTREDPAGMDNHGDRPEVREALAGRVGSSERYSATLGHRRIYVAVPVRHDGSIIAALRTSHSLTSIERALAVVQQRIALGGLLLAFGAAVISFVLARRISVPLRQMKEGAERFAAGQLGTRLSMAPDSEEIGALAETFNGMAEQLQDRIRTIENQRNEQEAVLASMVESVLAIDRDEVVIGINRAATELLGIEPAMAEGRTLQEVVRNPDLIALGKGVLGGGGPVEGEIVLRRDGERHLQVHATGLQGLEGQRLGALLVLNDVTRIRRLESLRRDFVANVSHELRTPITSIKGFVETLQNDPPADPDVARRFLTIVNRQADRLQAIIDDLLSLSRLEQEGGSAELAREATPVRPLLQDAVDISTARATDDVPTVRLECVDDLEVMVNAPLLEQALVNLLDNALKYSGTATEIVVAAHAEPDLIVVSVRDDGRGIAPTHLPRIFERFYRVDKARSRNMGGTGLGLAIVKHIAQAHGGEASVSSTLGEGTTFTITLPRRPDVDRAMDA
ncbi:HAMP domain-containing protein [bacterium]|nr:HAMP domain-containing protein [bacterium]